MFTKLFSETSDVSMMRFLSFLLVISGILLGFFAVFISSYYGKDATVSVSLVGIFIGSGITGKFVQSFAEREAVKKGD